MAPKTTAPKAAAAPKKSANTAKGMHRQASLTNVAQLTGVKWATAMLSDKVARRALATEEFEDDDKDKSGSLDTNEVIICITGICDKFKLGLPRPEKVHELIGLCDKNNDGVLQEAEFQQFFKAVLESAKRKAESELAKKHVKEIGGAKNGKTREIDVHKPPKWYPADDIKPKPHTMREMMSRGTGKLRPSITPGTVLIMLSGRFRGKRVVFLKRLPSGLLLVTGPYAVNGVPARRVNQAYVIATSTKLDVSKVDAAEWTDDDFGRSKAEKTEAKKRKRDGEEEGASKPALSDERVKKQKSLDGAILPAIEKTPLMKAYLKTLFTLNKADVPHKMKF